MSNGPLILIADDSQVSREYIAKILEPAGYRVVQAVDGGSALKVVNEQKVSLAIIDHYMSPFGGFEFAKNIQVGGIQLPMIMVTNEETSDLLVEITKWGMSGYLKKPADPKRLIELIRRTLRQRDEPELAAENVSIGSDIIKSSFTHEELIQKAIDLALHNVTSGKGGPFGAIVANEKGNILGEGANAATSRADPLGHAEVMAIRQATEKLNSLTLDGCSLYISSEPTRVGKALIDSVGISKVYYGLSAQELAQFFPSRTYKPVEYEQISRDAAFKMMTAIKQKS